MGQRLLSVLARFTRITIRLLDRLGARGDEPVPTHQRTGRRGEEDAYFHLRRQGYVMVARNYRSSRRRGEIDLIGWDQNVLCFIEVKTRTTHDVKPAEAAVDREKRRELAAMARDYLRYLPVTVSWRFDVISVYYDTPRFSPSIELFKNAFPVS
jgi:putative endonuclease